MALYRRGYNPDDLSQLNQPEMFYSDGLLEALKVYEKLVNPDNGYVGKTQAQINNTSLDFTSVQNKFLETQNKILFCPNGLWLEREMEANYDPEELNVEFIKTPVLSALSEQLSYYSETRGYSELSAAEKEKYDAVLSDIIDYVDGTSTEKPKFNGQDVSDADIERVRDARAFNSAAYNFNSVIPAYSTKIDLAKEFLQLMATDRGLEAMYAACGGSAPFEYGKSKLDARRAQRFYLQRQQADFGRTIYFRIFRGFVFQKQSVGFQYDQPDHRGMVCRAQRKRPCFCTGTLVRRLRIR